MLAIGRAFMSGRRMMLLDEPSMGLAPLLMMNVFDALKEINQQEGTAILLVEQNARLALQFSRRGLCAGKRQSGIGRAIFRLAKRSRGSESLPRRVTLTNWPMQ